MTKYFPILLLAALTACDLAPDLMMPKISMPSLFKEDNKAPVAAVAPAEDGRWKRSDEKAKIEETAWWRIFNDDVLNDLEEQAMKDNPSLDVALERVKSARAGADITGADQYPSAAIGFGPERQKTSPATINAQSPPGSNITSTKPYTLYRAQATLSYEVDLFGRNRNRALAALLDSEAEENNYRAARLTLQADVAQAYFSLATLTMQQNILKQTIATRQESLALIRQKRDIGAVDDLQVSASETDLSNVEADLAAVSQQVAQQQHALAVLVGKSPAEMAAVNAKINAAPPEVPAGIPSSLLERRPDIKVAEKQIAAANARIGVARTGYFPEISITALGGFVSPDLDNIFKWSNRTWLIGPTAGTILTQPIFEGGRVAATRAQSDANFAAATANYRVAVLQAFREVEDNLSGIRLLGEQGKATGNALQSAQRAYTIAQARYKSGYSGYLDNLDAERNLLAAQRRDVEVMGSRYVSTIQLIKALGGSWDCLCSHEVHDAEPATIDAVEVAPVSTLPDSPEEKASHGPALAPLAENPSLKVRLKSLFSF